MTDDIDRRIEKLRAQCNEYWLGPDWDLVPPAETQNHDPGDEDRS